MTRTDIVVGLVITNVLSLQTSINRTLLEVETLISFQVSIYNLDRTNNSFLWHRIHFYNNITVQQNTDKTDTN